MQYSSSFSNSVQRRIPSLTATPHLLRNAFFQRASPTKKPPKKHTVKLTVTRVKFNYRPAANALCVTQGDRRGSGSQVATLQATANTNHNGLGRCQELGCCPPTLQEQLMVTHRRHSPTVSLSLGPVGSVEKGRQYTLLATSFHNSCPALKIEHLNGTHCFIAGCRK